MVSINSNSASASALKVLRHTNAAINQAQVRLATGFRINAAQDDAAFWSISSALKSDRTSIKAIAESLNVSAATVDVAYHAQRQTADLLASFREKLVGVISGAFTATVAQSDIEAIKSQLSTIARSSAIFGENWAYTDSSVADHEALKKLITYIAEDQSHRQVDTIPVDLGRIALLDRNPLNGGILDSPKVSPTILIEDDSSMGVAGVAARAAAIVYNVSLSDLRPNHKLYFQMEYDGVVTPGGSWPGVLVPPSGFSSASEFAAALGAAVHGYANVTVVPDADAVAISTVTKGRGSTISIRQIHVYSNFGFTRASSDPLERSIAIVGVPGRDAVPFQAASISIPFAEPFSLFGDQSLTFTLSVDDAPDRNISITKEIIDLVTGRGNGRVEDRFEFERILRYAIDPRNSGNPIINVNLDGVEIRSSATSGPTRVSIHDAMLNSGTSVMGIQVVSKSNDELRSYISVIERAISQTSAASSYLGSISSRISSQSMFLLKRTDALGKAISTIVDADMEAESVRLKALQVKSELAIRSLSIANSALNSVSVLFQKP